MRRRILVVGVLVALGVAAVSRPASPAGHGRSAARVTIKLEVSGAFRETVTLSHSATSGTTANYGCQTSRASALGPGYFGLSYNVAALDRFDDSHAAVSVIVQGYRPAKERYTNRNAITIVVALRRRGYSGGGNRFKPVVIVKAHGRSGSFRAAPLVDSRHRQIEVVASWHCDKVT